MTATANKYARFFALLKQVKANGLIITKEEAVSVASFGRTDSLSSLSIEELKAAEHYLSQLTKSANKPAPPVGTKKDRMRKAIIAIFRSIGRTADDAKNWAEKYGVKGAKRAFNDYDEQELYVLIRNAEKVKADTIASVNKKLQKGGK